MSASRHRAEELCVLFDALFLPTHATCLEGGAAEPLYLPAAPGGVARILFRADYFASALHEIAHWCIAGAGRRRQLDYGYWYAPEGRGVDAQRCFEAVEARPQALEWLFADAAGWPFRVSIDNPELPEHDPAPFTAAVSRARHRLEAAGLPPRAARFHAALTEHYRRPWPTGTVR